MLELEDIRGQEFRWRAVSRFPLRVEWLGGTTGPVIERSWKSSGIDIRLAGIDWVVEPGLHLLKTVYTVSIKGSSHPLGQASCSHWKLSDFECTLDGIRTYHHWRESTHTAWWTLDGKERMEFNLYDVSGCQEGRISVSPQIELVDAPPLVAIGLVMHFGADLFLNLVDG